MFVREFVNWIYFANWKGIFAVRVEHTVYITKSCLSPAILRNAVRRPTVSVG